MKKIRVKIFISIFFAVIIFLLGVSLGSVPISFKDVFLVIFHKLFSAESRISDITVSIVWNLRLPRVMLAFVVGGALSVSGAVMQSVLKNPLASSYTLGVSSGASLGASFVIIAGLSRNLLGIFAMPFFGLVFGIATVFVVIMFAAKVDKQMGSNTIILSGMVFALFMNALQTLIFAFSRDHMQSIIFWQMGSFALKGFEYVFVLLPIVVVCIIFLIRYSRELDILTFGEYDALSVGVDGKKTKIILISLATTLTGTSVSFVGIIGFIDLITPHLVRRIFGASHFILLPLSFIIGGGFMVLVDTVARTVISPIELPVGAVSALLGAPFFAYVYFREKKV